MTGDCRTIGRDEDKQTLSGQGVMAKHTAKLKVVNETQKETKCNIHLHIQHATTYIFQHSNQNYHCHIPQHNCITSNALKFVSPKHA